MRNNPFKNVFLAGLAALMLVMPSIAMAQMAENGSGLPPIEQQLVRGGDLAVMLVFALGVGVEEDEAEAQSRLAEIGIAPEGGWIADYPVTPDIAGELRQAVAAAADAGQLTMDRDQALREFDEVLVELGLPVFPYSEETAGESSPVPAESYVEPEVVNSYYYSEGPPVVTYYSPPPAYTHLYSWVPYPFLTADYLFPGFFVLHDFHRTVVVHKRSFFVTNRFKDSRTHRTHRIDPRTRFKGDHFGVTHRHDSRTFRSGGVRGSDSDFFDRHRPRSLHHDRTLRPNFHGSKVFSRPSKESRVEKRRHLGKPKSFAKSSRHFGRDADRHFDRSGTFIPSSRDGRRFNRHSGGRDASHFKRGGPSGHHFHGDRSFHKPSSRGGSTFRKAESGRSSNPDSRSGRSSHGGRGRR
jgi:hypothetical protein